MWVWNTPLQNNYAILMYLGLDLDIECSANLKRIRYMKIIDLRVSM